MKELYAEYNIVIFMEEKIPIFNASNGKETKQIPLDINYWFQSANKIKAKSPVEAREKWLKEYFGEEWRNIQKMNYIDAEINNVSVMNIMKELLFNKQFKFEYFISNEYDNLSKEYKLKDDSFSFYLKDNHNSEIIYEGFCSYRWLVEFTEKILNDERNFERLGCYRINKRAD